MNLTRLMVLGLLDATGPKHGYRIRAIAEQTQAEGWGGISLGSLHRELRQMEGAGLVDPVRSEVVANRPVRTIYEITGLGRQVLREMREEAICVPRDGPDLLGVALLFGRIGDPDELNRLLQTRRAAIAGQHHYTCQERQRLVGAGLISDFDAAMFRRQEMRMEAELRWLDEYGMGLTLLPDVLPASTSDSEQPKQSHVSEEPSRSMRSKDAHHRIP